MISSAHVNYNFQSLVSDKDHSTIQSLQKGIANLIPGVTLIPSNEIHATWGQSAYFVDDKCDALQKIDLTNPRIKNDYNTILSHLKKNLSSMQISNLAPARFSKFRITENGFIIAELKSNTNVEKIARSFQYASYAALSSNYNESPYLNLTKHYRDSDEFGFHIALGQINNLAEIEKYTKDLNGIANTFEFANTVSFSISEKGSLTAAYKTHGQRIHIYRDEFSFAEEPSLKANTHTSTSLVMQNNPTGPILYSFNNTKQPVTTLSDINVASVKTALSQFFPEAKTKNIGIKYPSPDCPYYQITFVCKQDKIDFSKKFAKYPGQKGECTYSKFNENHVWMDQDAVLTLMENNKSSKKLQH